MRPFEFIEVFSVIVFMLVAPETGGFPYSVPCLALAEA